MTELPTGVSETQRNVLVYLKSLQLLTGDLNLEIVNGDRSGILKVRGGEVVAGECGELSGNGAVLTLAGIKEAQIHTVQANDSPEKNVSLSIVQVERLLTHFSRLSPSAPACDEKKTLETAVHLLHQFRRKEAGAKLVEILRYNRFYYPAWLWHSRLMTREDYIKKALNEAKKWGNNDPGISREAEKIEPQLSDSSTTARRCFFCWSVVKVGKTGCDYCGGSLSIAKRAAVPIRPAEIEQALSVYEQEFKKNPENTRVAYCLSLGSYSLGNCEQAENYATVALKISPQEPLLQKTASALATIIKQQRKTIKPSSPAKERQKNIPGKEVAAGGKKQKTILVVEDSKTSRKVISMLLSRKGHEIVEATTGKEALARVAEMTPDLILLDVMLPDMTGYEILPVVKAKLPGVPVVMLTGKTSSTDRLRGMKSGADEYLTKPFDPGKLLSVIARYLKKSVVGVVDGGAPAPKYIKKVVEVAPPPPPPRPKQVAEDSGGFKRSILVVEDSPTSRKVIAMVLAKKGYAISEAATGEEALESVKRNTPDLVLLDAMLPDTTGYELLPQLRDSSVGREVPVVMLTGKTSSVDRERGMQAGSVAYLTKPFDPERLLAVIDEHI